MKLQSKRALQIFLTSALLLISCDISTFVAAPQLPTTVPGVINLLAAETAAAAATQTAALIPPTLTSTPTPFPTQTPADTSTFTPTFIFLLATLTPATTPTSASPTNVGGGFACDLTKQSPLDEASFNRNHSFTLTWKIQNTGSKPWLQDNVSLNYVSGDQFADTTLVNLPSSIASGNSVVFTMKMITRVKQVSM